MRWSSPGCTTAALGHGLAPHWPSQFAPLGIRIDHCLVIAQWRSVRVRLGPSLGSDHLPLMADLRAAAPMRPTITCATRRMM